MTQLKIGKLGCKPPKYDPRTLCLDKYMDFAALPPIPPQYNWGSPSAIPSWFMMLNDRLGICTIAAAGHLIMGWTRHGLGKTLVVPDPELLLAYEAVSGYVPGNPATDNGADPMTVFKYWQNTGIGSHKIGAYGSIDFHTPSHVNASTFLFEGSYVAANLPQTAMDQFEAGKPWSVVSTTGAGAPGSLGGHAFPIISFAPWGLAVVTWGQLQRMTYGFLQTYGMGLFGLISADMLNSKKKAPTGFDLPQLQADLQMISTMGPPAATASVPAKP
jgi:hypothetical protein